MRTTRFDRLLAGTILALTAAIAAAAPLTGAWGAPTILHSPPPPPTLHSQPQSEAAPSRPAPVLQPRVAPDSATAARAQVVPPVAAEANDSDNDNGVIKGAIDRLYSAAFWP
jgi:hypothetical protein